MQAGDCFYNKASSGIPSHPWIIISDTEEDPNNVVIVNFTDADSHHDLTCVLTQEDIPWLTKRSCVAYQFAKLTTLCQLEEAEGKGLLLDPQTVSDKILMRIRDGAVTSEETKNACLVILRAQGLA